MKIGVPSALYGQIGQFPREARALDAIGPRGRMPPRRVKARRWRKKKKEKRSAEITRERNFSGVVNRYLYRSSTPTRATRYPRAICLSAGVKTEFNSLLLPLDFIGGSAIYSHADARLFSWRDVYILAAGSRIVRRKVPIDLFSLFTL